MNLAERIPAYLEDHETAWAHTTYKSEKARLASACAHLNAGPEKLMEWAKAKGMKPYAIKTLFIRVCSLEKWAKGDAYQTWFRKHKNRFKHAYERKAVKISHQEAVARIQTLDEPYRTQALEMLQTGLRISEVGKVKDGLVQGKGEKRRLVFGTISVSVPQAAFRAKLKAVGLTPHDLRRLCATRLMERGATPADLCEVFGWSSISTAFFYLAPRNEGRLRALMGG